MWDRKELKRQGKAAFLANYWRSVLVALLLAAFVFGYGAASGSSVRKNVNGTNGEPSVNFQDGKITVNGQSYDTVEEAVTAAGEAAGASAEEIQSANELIDALQNDPEFQAAVLKMAAVAAGALMVIMLISGLLRLLVFNPLEVGGENFFVRNAEAPAELGELGRGFHPYWRTVWTMFLRGLFLTLWTLLFIVPGFIKCYSYRMVPYILADDPNIGGTEAITLSRRMMNGHKWNAFVLDLSFLGWHILSLLTLGLLGIFFVQPYQLSTNAELYRALKEQK